MKSSPLLGDWLRRANGLREEQIVVGRRKEPRGIASIHSGAVEMNNLGKLNTFSSLTEAFGPDNTQPSAPGSAENF